MIPVKCLSFGEAVNVTLGLPFIRTSVDHGTAFDIAGKGIAEHSSMVAAIKLAAELISRKPARAAEQWKQLSDKGVPPGITRSSQSKTINETTEVLVADDDPAILRLITTILEKENYEVVQRARRQGGL